MIYRINANGKEVMVMSPNKNDVETIRDLLIEKHGAENVGEIRLNHTEGTADESA